MQEVIDLFGDHDENAIQAAWSETDEMVFCCGAEDCAYTLVVSADVSEYEAGIFINFCWWQGNEVLGDVTKMVKLGDGSLLDPARAAVVVKHILRFLAQDLPVQFLDAFTRPAYLRDAQVGQL